VVSGLGLGHVNNKKGGPTQPEGRSGTGKYCDGAWAGAHTNRELPLRTWSPCYGRPSRAINPGTWRDLCHQGKYEDFKSRRGVYKGWRAAHGPSRLSRQLTPVKQYRRLRTSSSDSLHITHALAPYASDTVSLLIFFRYIFFDTRETASWRYSQVVRKFYLKKNIKNIKILIDLYVNNV